jgi:hypothetical protein
MHLMGDGRGCCTVSIPDFGLDANRTTVLQSRRDLRKQGGVQTRLQAMVLLFVADVTALPIVGFRSHQQR